MTVKRATNVQVIFKWLLLLVSLLPVAAGAEIYQCRDADGRATFQNRPCPDSVTQAATADNKQDKHFLWQATAGRGKLYLLGSIHFGAAEMYPLPRAMLDAFHQSSTLVVEADILNVDPAQMAQLVAQKAMYTAGATLRQQLSVDTWKRLEEAATSLGMPVAMLDQQKPWFVSMSLTALALRQLGYSEDRGIDRYFLDLARGKKKIVELESLAWQLSLFDKLTKEEQITMLEETLRELDHGKAFFERMLKAWQAGDIKGIQALFDEGMMNEKGSERLNKLIMTDRNHSMTQKLDKMARQGGTHLVVVGAGHLTGDEGIIALLKGRGYQVSQL